jgi:hypothetical protein
VGPPRTHSIGCCHSRLVRQPSQGQSASRGSSNSCPCQRHKNKIEASMVRSLFNNFYHFNYTALNWILAIFTMVLDDLHVQSFGQELEGQGLL